MGETTKISWCNSTFNMWRGCSRLSPGCAKCYAEKQSGRNPKVLGVWGPNGTRVLASENMWKEPLKWEEQARIYNQKPWRVFCASLADVFEDWSGTMKDSQGNDLHCTPGGPRSTFDTITALSWPEYTLDHARTRLFALIRKTPNLTWLLLTKRPTNVVDMMPHGNWSNVWLGTSVESQEYMPRLDALQEAREKVKVPVLFCSAEPLLGPLEFGQSLGNQGISWIIVGGESGGEARPFHREWAESIRDQCKKAKTAFFMKQMGSNPSSLLKKQHPEAGRIPLNYGGKGDDPNKWPKSLEIQEFPQ